MKTDARTEEAITVIVDQANPDDLGMLGALDAGIRKRVTCELRPTCERCGADTYQAVVIAPGGISLRTICEEQRMDGNVFASVKTTEFTDGHAAFARIVFGLAESMLKLGARAVGRGRGGTIG